LQGEVAVSLSLRRRADREHPLTFDDHAQAVCQYLCPPGLVDKVDGAPIERLQLPFYHGVAGQEDDRQFDAALSEGAQQLEAGHLRQHPVEQQNLYLDAILQGLEEERPIGKATDRKPSLREVRGEDLSE